MKNKVRFSVCIFTYNRAKYIADAITSVTKQIYTNYELIIVDDGSTDNTEEIVKSFESDKIKYIKKEHSGAPATRNRAIKEATGDFIVWLADDDILLPSALQYYAIYLAKTPNIDLLYCNLKSFNDDTHETKVINGIDWYNKNDEALAFLMKGSPITDGGCAIKRKIYDEIGNYNEDFKRAQDYEFWSRLIQKQKYILMNVPKYLYLYRLHGNNITGLFNKNTDFSYEIKIIKNLLENNKLEQLFPKFEWDRNRKEAEFISYFFLTSKFYFLGNIKLGEEYLNKCLQIRKLNEEEIKQIYKLMAETDKAHAEKMLDVLNRTYEDPILKKYDFAIKKMDGGEIEIAETELESILAETKNSSDKLPFDTATLHIVVGNLSLIQKKLENAKLHFENALELNPFSSPACKGLGEIFEQVEEYEPAKTMYEWAIKNDESNEGAKQKLTVVNKMLGLDENDFSLSNNG